MEKTQRNVLPAALLGSILSAVLGSLQIGYHTGNVNAPAMIIKQFFNTTWRARYNELMSDQTLTVLWSVSVSIKDFGALLGALGFKYMVDSFGRRNSILIANGLSVVGAVLMSLSKLAKSFEVLIVGRLVFGVFCGLVMSMNPLYVQEVSPTNLRGAFATLNQVAYTLGILIGMVVGLETALGTWDQWDLMLCLSLIPALLQYLLLPFCPESPGYLLLTRGQEAKAESALLRLRGDPDIVRAELEEMKERETDTQASISIQQFFTKASYRQPILLVLVIALGSQLSGFNAMINYSTKMFEDAFSEAKYLTLGVGAANVTFSVIAMYEDAFSEAKYLTLGVGAANVTFSVVAFFLMEKAGRRKLLLTGFLIILVCNLLLTIVDALQTLVPQLRFLQVVAVFCLVSAYELGPGPISWFIAAELFDQQARPIAMAFTSMLNWGGKFLLALIYPPLLDVMGGYVYLLFMATALVALCVTWCRMPETRGRSFDDIAEEFRGAEGILMQNKSHFNTFK